MITFEEAIRLVREQFSHDYVTEGFEYDGEYVFRILSHDYKKMYTNQVHLVSVNMNEPEVMMLNLEKVFTDLDGYDKAQKKSIKIDKYE